MSQAEYEWINHCLGICHVLLQTTCFLWLWNIFCPVKVERKAVILAGALEAVNVLISALPETPNGSRYVISAGLILGYVMIRKKKYLERAVFVLLLFFNFHGLSFLISDSIYQYGMEKLLENLEIQSQIDLSQVYERTLLGQGALIVVYALLLLLMTGILRKVVKKSMAMNWQEVIFLSALNLVGGMLAEEVPAPMVGVRRAQAQKVGAQKVEVRKAARR